MRAQPQSLEHVEQSLRKAQRFQERARKKGDAKMVSTWQYFIVRLTKEAESKKQWTLF